MARREIAQESRGWGGGKHHRKLTEGVYQVKEGKERCLQNYLLSLGAFSPRESLAFLERFLSATLEYVAQRGGKSQGKNQCLEEKATVLRWLQSPCVKNTYAGYWWQDRETRMWASSSQPQTFRTPTDDLLTCPSVCLHSPHTPVC